MNTMPVNSVQVYRRSELQAVLEGCLFRTKKIWVDGEDDTSDMAMLGIGFHRIQHQYVLRLLDQQVGQDADEARAAFVEGVTLSKTPPHLIPELRALWDWHTEKFELAYDRFVTAEERQVVSGTSFAPDLVLAHPERNELEQIDHKTGWAPPLSEAELKLNFQARFNTRQAMARWPGFTSYRFTIDAVRFRKYVSVTFTANDIPALDAEVTAAVATYEQAKLDDVWPAVAGPSCHFCQLACPIMDQSLEVPKRLLERRQAQQVAAWITAGEQMIRQGKKALKGYVSSHGPVEVNGVVWDNRETIGMSYPVDYVNKALNETGSMGAYEDAKEMGLTISQSALKKLFSRFPKLQEMLAPVAIQKSSWRFSAKQPGKAEEVDE